MSLLDRFFSKKRAGREAVAADLAGGQIVRGQATGQTADEQLAIRGRMEAELEAQRERRVHPAQDDA